MSRHHADEHVGPYPGFEAVVNRTQFQIDSDWELWSLYETQSESMSLAALLWKWLRDHESCLANAVGVTDFSVVTSIPSLRATHPLKTMVGDMIAITKSRYEPLLKAGPSFNSERVCRVDMFEVTRGSRSGEPVLVIDDTFTTGSHVQSAAAALKQAGFGPVGVMCIGRHWVKKDDVRFAAASAEYLKRSKALGWNWEYCCLCDSRSS